MTRDDRPIVAFLYELMRDHVVPGKVERVTLNSVHTDKITGFELSNDGLAQYAQEVADRLNRIEVERRRMPNRKKAPRIQVVVEFEINSPNPGEITKKMVEEMHEKLRTLVHYNIPDDEVTSQGMTAAHIRTMRVVE